MKKAIVGISGGVDSSLALHTAVNSVDYEVVAAVTADNGWDTDIAKQNVKALVDKLEVRHEVVKFPWPEFGEIQKAFLYASTPDAECPTDLGIKKVLLDKMKELGADVIITGANRKTEGRMPEEWSMIDGRYLRDVCRRFGVKIKDYPVLGLWDQFKYKRSCINILDSIDYVPAEAKKFLVKEYGWQDYGGKHEENIYTRFVRGLRYYKFGIDARVVEFYAKLRAHQMTGSEILKEMDKPIIPAKQFIKDCETVERKLVIDMGDILEQPAKTFRDYKTWRYHPAIRAGKKLVGWAL